MSHHSQSNKGSTKEKQLTLNRSKSHKQFSLINPTVSSNNVNQIVENHNSSLQNANSNWETNFLKKDFLTEKSKSMLTIPTVALESNEIKNNILKSSQKNNLYLTPDINNNLDTRQSFEDNQSDILETTPRTTRSSRSHSILTPQKDADIISMKKLLLNSLFRYREARKLQLEKIQAFEEKMKDLRELERKNKIIYNTYLMKCKTLDDIDREFESFHSTENTFDTMKDIGHTLDGNLSKDMNLHLRSLSNEEINIDTLNNGALFELSKNWKGDKQMDELTDEWMTSITRHQELTNDLNDLSKAISDKKLIFHANKKLTKEKIQLNIVAQADIKNIVHTTEMIEDSNLDLRSFINTLHHQISIQKQEMVNKKETLQKYQINLNDLEKECSELSQKSILLQQHISNCASELIVSKLRLETIKTERTEFEIQKINKLRKPTGKIILERKGDSLVMILKMPNKERIVNISEIEDVESLLESPSKLRIIFQDPSYNRYNIFICQKRALLIRTLKDWMILNAKIEATKKMNTKF